MLPIVVAERFRSPGQEHAGVIDHSRDPAEMLDGQAHRQLNLLGDTDVAYHGKASRADLLGNSVQLLAVAPADSDPGAFLGESCGDGSPDAAPASTDDRDFVGQTHGRNCKCEKAVHSILR